MFPVFLALKKRALDGAQLEIKWVSTAQHKHLLEDLESFFQIKADFEFEIHDSQNPKTRLGNLNSQLIQQATDLFNKEKPDLIFVQGDTLSSQSCAIAAFYQKIKIAHIEAGLRTNSVYNPFPEEFSRRVISQIANLNFSPEPQAQDNLEFEKKLYKKQSLNFHTGNTVIDCLKYSMDKIYQADFNWQNFNYINEAFDEKVFDLDNYLKNLEHKKYILFTAHRRENLVNKGGLCKMDNLINAIKRISENKLVDDYEFVFMIHKNPEARKPFEEFYLYCKEHRIEKIKFLEAASYPAFLKLMSQSHFIVTDSGGIQEEAPYLKKPVLIFRDNTERLTGLEMGLTKLVGTDELGIHTEILDLISNEKSYHSMIENGFEPYGDGQAASKIVENTLLYMQKSS